jgi:hypothetical protein
MQNKISARLGIGGANRPSNQSLLVGVGAFELGTIYSFNQAEISSINLFCTQIYTMVTLKNCATARWILWDWQ